MKKFDPVDADDGDDDGPNPIPDDDGHVILKRKEASDAERGRDNQKSGTAREAAPRRTGTNARKTTGKGK